MTKNNVADSHKIIFHIDVNSAYLSWSAIRELEMGGETDLREVPSIVGGDVRTRHGVVLAKSIPAKRYGVKTGEPVAMALRKCPGLISVSPDHTYYREKSRQLMRFLREFSSCIEQVSVDECYLDYSAMVMARRDSSPEETARRMADGVFQEFGYTVNIGISDKKVLAKMASDFEKPNRVHTLYKKEIQEKMWPLPVGRLYMCGKSADKKLRLLGIETIGDLAAADPEMIEAHLKKHGVMLQSYALGSDESRVIPVPARAKGIGNSTTLSRDVTGRGEAAEVLWKLSLKVSERLKKQHFLANGVCTEIKYSSFQSVSHQCIMSSPSASEKRIYETALKLFDELWNGEPVRLLGIRTTKLMEDDEPVQMSLSDYEQVMPEIKKSMEKKKKLDAAMQSIRRKYGEGAIHRGMPWYIE